MKTAIVILASLLLASLPLHAGTGTLLKATVTGTVQTQALLSPTDGRIHTTVLNNNRIFQEFQVSKTDYELCAVFEGDVLVLVPKSASSPLPAITVVDFNNKLSTVVDTKARVGHIVGNVNAGTATNLFKNVSGEVSGTIHYVGPVTSPVFTKFVFSMVGAGTDTATNGDAILKFKVTTTGHFTQTP